MYHVTVFNVFIVFAELGKGDMVMCVRQEIGVIIQGASRMRESRTYGSVRGRGLSTERPYRDPQFILSCLE